jgi:membrane-associated phospholipid phosphatase
LGRVDSPTAVSGRSDGVNARARAAWYGGIAVAVGVASSRARGRELDHRVFHALNADRGRAADLAFEGVTELGSIGAQAGAAAVLAQRGRGRAAGRALGAAGATWLLGQALKKAWRRARPYDEFAGTGTARLLIGKPKGTSWPSSHPAVLTAFLTVAERELGLGAGTRAGLAALRAAIGVSRIALGVHFPSDVASGLLLGRAVGLLWPENGRSGR